MTLRRWSPTCETIKLFAFLATVVDYINADLSCIFVGDFFVLWFLLFLYLTTSCFLLFSVFACFCEDMDHCKQITIIKGGSATTLMSVNHFFSLLNSFFLLSESASLSELLPLSLSLCLSLIHIHTYMHTDRQTDRHILNIRVGSANRSL